MLKINNVEIANDAAIIETGAKSHSSSRQGTLSINILMSDMIATYQRLEEELDDIDSIIYSTDNNIDFDFSDYKDLNILERIINNKEQNVKIVLSKQLTEE